MTTEEIVQKKEGSFQENFPSSLEGNMKSVGVWIALQIFQLVQERNPTDWIAIWSKKAEKKENQPMQRNRSKMRAVKHNRNDLQFSIFSTNYS